MMSGGPDDSISCKAWLTRWDRPGSDDSRFLQRIARPAGRRIGAGSRRRSYRHQAAPETPSRRRAVRGTTADKRDHGRDVVAPRGLLRAFHQFPHPRAHIRRGPDMRQHFLDLAVPEPVAQSIGANQQDVARLDRLGPDIGLEYVDRVAEALVDLVALRMLARLGLGDEAELPHAADRRVV